MENYRDEESASFELDFAETDEQKEAIRKEIEANKDSTSGNIDLVAKTIDNLIAKLSNIDNLPQLLEKDDFETLDIDVYFSNFHEDKGDGYIGNNFGHNLRKFKRFLDYAKAHGSTTVYFSYG